MEDIYLTANSRPRTPLPRDEDGESTRNAGPTVSRPLSDLDAAFSAITALSSVSTEEQPPSLPGDTSGGRISSSLNLVSTDTFRDEAAIPLDERSVFTPSLNPADIPDEESNLRDERVSSNARLEPAPWKQSSSSTPKHLAEPSPKWDEIPCIAFLIQFRECGGVSERNYQILLRMCQIIWAIGHEVEIRKQVKLPRGERLGKLRHFAECICEGAELFTRNMLAKTQQVWDAALGLPRLDDTAYQDLEPKLDQWSRAFHKLFYPSNTEARLFKLMLEHYRKNYKILYGLHREKPDYGLIHVFPAADKAFRLLLKLPEHADEAADAICHFEDTYRDAIQRHREDWTRQHYAVNAWNNLPQEAQKACFDEYMRDINGDFIKGVNARAATMPMSLDQFRQCMAICHRDFLKRVLWIIKYNLEIVDHRPIHIDLKVKLPEVRQHLTSEATKGWVQALRLGFGAAFQDQPVVDGPTDAELEQLDRLEAGRYGNSAESSYLESADQQSHQQADTPSVAESGAEGHVPNTIRRPPQHYADGEDAKGELPFQRSELLDASARTVPKTMVPIHLSKSFAAVEDDLAHRAHHRSSTVPDVLYTTDSTDESDPPRPDISFQGRLVKTQRHGVQVPRVFTGSFSQLESDIRSLQLHKVTTPEGQPGLSEIHNMKIRDFAVTPQRSPSPIPSPVSLLFRREALLIKKTELCDRLINGEVVVTRRPSKGRAQTIDDTTGGLQAWLAREEGRSDSPTLAVPPLPLPERKHTM